jgi:hypothetical protein
VTPTDESDRTLTEHGADLDKTPAVDHLFIAALASLNAVPTVGGFLATFLSEYVPRRKQARLVAFVQELAKRVEAERDRIDQEFVRSDEFSGLFEDVLDKVQDRRNEEKFQYWAALVAGMASTTRPAKADRDRMIDTLEELRLSHLQLLSIVATTTVGPPDTLMGSIGQTLQWKLPETPLEDLIRDWGDLARVDLLQGYVGGLMTAMGAGNLTVRITPYGQRFLAMLETGTAPQ